MTPKQKAQELFDKMCSNDGDEYHHCTYYVAKACALIAVDEIIDQVYSISHQYTAIYDENTKFWNYTESKELKYWQEVKQEIEAL
jgi:hypothetical protein